MALTKTSIIKTRSQSRTGTKARTTAPAAPAHTPVAVATGGRTTGTTTRTGPNVRTNDDTIDTGRTIDSNVAPAPVVNTTDLFANRPKTGALKDPPAPRDRDSDPDSDAKKPAAKPKPKGRPKKVVAPKATRKPRKPRNVDANELVDPMSRVHVTAGGIARAGGNDPVLADSDYQNPPVTPRSGTVR